MADRNQIQHGADVYDCNGNKIGDVGAIGTNHMHVETGGFLGIGSKDLYVPYSDVTNVEDNGQKVCLNVSKDQIENQGWENQPQEVQTGQPMGYGTVPAAEQQPRQQYTAPAPQQPQAAQPAERQQVREMPLREEHLEAHRTRQQVGEVDVSKRLVHEKETFEVPVTHEEVVITERPENRAASQGPSAQGETIRVPIYEEEVHFEKEPRVYGEVTVSKEPVTEEQEVQGTVTREVPHIEKKGNVEGDVEVQGNLNQAGRNLNEAERNRLEQQNQDH